MPIVMAKAPSWLRNARKGRWDRLGLKELEARNKERRELDLLEKAQAHKAPERGRLP